MVSDDVIGVMWMVALTAVLCGLVAWPLIRAARGAGRVLATRGEVAEVPRPAAGSAIGCGDRVVSRVSGLHGVVTMTVIGPDGDELYVMADDGTRFASEPENLMRESIVAGGDVLWMHELAKSRQELDELGRTGRLPW